MSWSSLAAVPDVCLLADHENAHTSRDIYEHREQRMRLALLPQPVQPNYSKLSVEVYRRRAAQRSLAPLKEKSNSWSANITLPAKS